MADQTFIGKAILTLVAAYPNANIGKETMHLYATSLADVPAEVLDLAVTQCISTSKWFPTIAELREAAARIQTGADQLPPAGEAWGECLRVIARLGYYEQPTFDNPITAKVAAAMGWKKIAEQENPAADRARFIELYNTYAQRNLQQAQLPPRLRADSPALQLMQGLVKKLGSGK